MRSSYHLPGTPTQDQENLVRNYNFLCAKLNENGIEIFELIDDALCNGLGKLFLLKAKENRLDEFQYFIHFMTSLSKENAQLYAQQYSKNHKLKVSLPGEEAVSFKKIIDFMMAVYKTQKTQLETHFKSILANWDSNNMLCCPMNELASYLKSYRVMDLPENEKVQFKFFSSGDHSMALFVFKEEDKEMAYYYDASFKQTIICHDEDDLAAAMEISLEKIQFDEASFFIHDLSWGDTTGELDDILLNFDNLLTEQAEMMTTVQQYKKGMLSRRDTAFLLNQQSLGINLRSEKLDQFNIQLQAWLDKHPIQTTIPWSVDVNNRINTYNETLLHVASKNNSPELAQLLIAAGADLNITTTEGCTPLHLACIAGSIALAQLLIAAGADLNVASSKGWSPLQLACKNGSLALTQLLIAAGIDLNEKMKESGWTAFHVACKNGKHAVVQLLIQSDVDPNIATKDGRTALHLACENRDFSLVQILLAEGALPNIADINGQTPLHVACLNGDLELVKKLIAAGADSHAKTKKGWTPLTLADKYEYEHVTTFLKQQLTVNDIVLQSNIDGNRYDPLAIKISKLFNSYAHPPIFSSGWFQFREQSKLADEISTKFKQNPQWNEIQCRTHLATLVQGIQFENMDSFIGILDKANQLINQSTGATHKNQRTDFSHK